MEICMKKIIFLLSLISMLFCTAAYAEEITDFTVTERNNTSVSDYLIKRGIPLAEGQCNVDERQRDLPGMYGRDQGGIP